MSKFRLTEYISKTFPPAQCIFFFFLSFFLFLMLSGDKSGTKSCFAEVTHKSGIHKFSYKFGKVGGQYICRSFIKIMSMKKLLVIMCAAIGSVSSFAQIKMEQTFANEIIVLGELSGGAALNVIGNVASAMGGGYYSNTAEHKLFCRCYHDSLAVGILVQTANRFDDDMEIALGKDFETARQSFSDLVSWYDNSVKGQSVSFMDIWGRRVQVNRNQNNISVNVIDDIDSRIVAENVLLKRENLVKGMTLLDNPKKRTEVYLKLLDLGQVTHPFAVAYKDELLKVRKEHETLVELKDSTEARIDSIKEQMKLAKKSKDKGMVSVLKDSLAVLRTRHGEIVSELSGSNVSGVAM